MKLEDLVLDNNYTLTMSHTKSSSGFLKFKVICNGQVYKREYSVGYVRWAGLKSVLEDYLIGLSDKLKEGRDNNG